MSRSLCSLFVGLLLLGVMCSSVEAQRINRMNENVSVALIPYNPPITIPGSGGQFAYSVEVVNGEATAIPFDVWTTYTLPSGGGDVEGYGPVELLLPGGWSAAEDLSQVIPGGMPEGMYVYTAYAGIYPDDVWDNESFEFEKLPGSAGWYAQTPGAENGLTGVSFVDTNNGWAVSSYQEIIHTTDGGDVWLHQDDGQYYPHEYNDVHFVDALTGWVVGHGWSLGGTILHTTDAGATWIEQDPYHDYNLNSVFFTDSDIGWVVGGYVDILGSNHRRVIAHTSNGGDTWDGQFWQSYSYPFQAVHFADASNGWAVGGPGGIVHTTDGGDTWSEQYPGTTRYLQDVFFINAATGWCVGDGGTVLHTTDGGSNWQTVSTGISAEFRSVFFVGADRGWIAGVDYGLEVAVIIHTEDGGLNWQEQDTGTGDQLIWLHEICFVDANQGWIAGQLWPDVGVMLHTENGGKAMIAGVEGGRHQDAELGHRVLSDTFPNPFNPTTNIRFVVPGEASQPVKVAVFDLQGRRIRTLLDGVRNAGEHAVLWDGLTDGGEPAASGIYIYRIGIGGVATSGRLSLVR